jgi:hypothetical protein
VAIYFLRKRIIVRGFFVSGQRLLETRLSEAPDIATVYMAYNLRDAHDEGGRVFPYRKQEYITVYPNNVVYNCRRVHHVFFIV